MTLPDAEPAADRDAARSAEWWLQAVRREERRGELLTAFDLAERGLAEHPGDLWLEHRAVLALARAGATEQAAERLRRAGLDRRGEEDIAALRARIAKDVALAAEAEQRARGATDAAELYRQIFIRTGGYYPAINAATLSLVAGDGQTARALAREVLALLAASPEDSYYALATEGEAHLLLGDADAARDALTRAVARLGGDHGAMATTRRQLRIVCRLTGIAETLLEVLAGPAVVHFCGHRIGPEPGPFPAAAEAPVAAGIAAAVADNPPGYAYGALASGADILWAEALLAAGSELHVVLPFALEEFIHSSVAVSGPAWVQRFHDCLQAAAAVSFATDDAFLGDDVLFRYGSELAMGLALLRARHLDADARQLAVWDGRPARGDAGTAIDVATWGRQARTTTVIAPDGSCRDGAGLGEPAAKVAREVAAGQTGGRVVRALLFGDVKGFSKLTDEQLPRFSERVLGAFAAVLEAHSEDVWHRNTWGDAVYVVLSGAPAAAACALELQEAMAAIELEAEGLPGHLALRLGGHLGPVFPTIDPVLGQLGFMGSHVSRTARIEPVTPPGAVYVTEAFAAALVLDGRREFVCDYVGHMPAAKDYGRLRMHRLRRRVLDGQPAPTATDTAA